MILLKVQPLIDVKNEECSIVMASSQVCLMILRLVLSQIPQDQAYFVVGIVFQYPGPVAGVV